MPWLRTYRQFKTWLFAPNLQANRVTFKEQTSQHSITIFTSFLLWTAIVWLDHLTGPELTFGPLYLIPCATLALVVGRGWGPRRWPSWHAIHLVAQDCAPSVTTSVLSVSDGSSDDDGGRLAAANVRRAVVMASLSASRRGRRRF